MKITIRSRIESIKNLKIINKFLQFTSSNVFISVVAKSLVTLIIWAGALTPIWIYALIRWVASPIGFWQEFAIIIICGIVMGWLQVVLIIMAFLITIGIIAEDHI